MIALSPASHRLATLTLVCALLSACQPKTEDAAPASTAAPSSTSPTPSDAASGPASTASVTAPAQVPVAASEAASSSGLVTGFNATGFSPAWRVEVRDDQLSILIPELSTGPDDKPVVVKAKHLAYAKGVNFEGEHAGKKFVLDIRSGPCDKATEGGKPREFHATFEYGKTRYAGCADGLR